MKSNKQSIYDQAIKMLMRDDPNTSWDEIIEESDNDINIAYNMLIDDLKQTIEDNDDIEVKEFYQSVLNSLV